MRFVSWLKGFWKERTNQSDHIIKDRPLWTDNERSPMNIEYKLQLQASELTSNQQVIDEVAEKIIQQDYSKREFAGKNETDLMANHRKVYQYETFRSHAVKLVPNQNDRLDVYVENTYLGKIPKDYTSDTTHYLQSTVVMSFVYIKGGPYKYYDEETHETKTGVEPYDLNIYIQFS